METGLSDFGELLPHCSTKKQDHLPSTIISYEDYQKRDGTAFP